MPTPTKRLVLAKNGNLELLAQTVEGGISCPRVINKNLLILLYKTLIDVDFDPDVRARCTAGCMRHCDVMSLIF